ncbi:HAD-IC family P-type ATPase [bacterium]|nr:HAD-IC family P-type ATPase [bacterium]
MDATLPASPRGLSEAEARERLDRDGRNEIPEQAPDPFRGVLKRLWGPIPWMLEGALVLELALGKVAEPAMIAAWLLFSAVVGGVQEQRAQRVLDLLRSRLRVSARVRRDGAWRMIAARDIVAGDEIRLRAGDLVPADATVRDGTIELDQSSLTGESALVSRGAGEAIYSASTVRRGEATAVVTATGGRTFFGRTAELVRSARSAGHLDQLLFAVVRHLVTIDAILAAVLVAFALWSGAPLLELVPFLLVLVIATVPVTMPAAFTVANAVEARALAGEGVLVTGLSAVQEAATMDVLCVDKTGTLTENRQVVVAVVALATDSEDEVLALAGTACDASTQEPLEAAILEALRQRAVPLPARQSFVAFDPARKRSEATIERDGAVLRVVMGSPLVVQDLAGARPELAAQVERLAATGARVLAVAAGPDGALSIRGLVALADTPRRDAAALVQALRGLGVRLLMLSGDTLATARAVARQVGLGERFGDAAAAKLEPLRFDGFAHCYPQDKFDLVQTLQRSGRVTGMTGDGVNDAPALKQAEVGIAVSSASDVAKAAAQVVLTRPGLQDMIAVVHSGRRVYRRMLTWTLTKIARTVELAALLAVGYIATGFFVTSLLLIAVLVILNDVVTITLATDRAWISPLPERWNVAEIGKVAGLFAVAWLALAFVILAWALNGLHLSVPQIQTLMFAFLIYSAQATIYLTRVRGRLWSFAPSRWVALATLGNVLIASAMGLFGLLAAAVPAFVLLATLAAVLATTLVLDELKLRLLQRTTVFGPAAPEPS